MLIYLEKKNQKIINYIDYHKYFKLIIIFLYKKSFKAYWAKNLLILKKIAILNYLVIMILDLCIKIIKKNILHFIKKMIVKIQNK